MPADRSQGGSGIGCQRPAPGLDYVVDALPWSERGELQGRFWRQTDPDWWCIPPPYTLEHLPDLEEALARFQYQDPIVLGDLNSDIIQAQNPCSQHPADLLMGFGLVYLIHNLR